MAHSQAAHTPDPDGRPELTLTRRLKAQPAKVFAAWTDPARLVRWFGPAHTQQDQVRADMDVRVGGTYRISFEGADGEKHQVGGVYREIEPVRRLVFSWAWHTTPERESLVTVTLKPDGAGTLLTLHHQQFADDAARDGHRAGWTGTLDKLEQLFA